MAEAVKAAAARQLPAFKLGQRQVYLPTHIITMLHKEHLPANEACFQVPITFTKFDLRDYLWNLYNVEVKTVRSYVKGRPLAERPNRPGSTYRPQALKIMTVELAQPFQWPALPADRAPWNHELFEMREASFAARRDDQYNAANRIIPMASRQPRTEERKKLAGLAKDLLSGRKKWSNQVQLDSKWDAIVQEATAGAKPGSAKKESAAERIALEKDAKDAATRTNPKPEQ
ncbi:mitochondrial ribosomal protein L23, putative [Cordyceps militaris CM01]|uniref:Large ribosomal subunit protein uL23m n=2 Tax=Cordyceps militaris TaxID=73501 RepID=G3JM50_CORMM|nr:mitochondrial ribosomal protein L23, putative [Cordyceps militaris CM01]ATY62773.1 Ribosomal L25 L23 [Cordyceps militaris]EGX90774.1 mitochondrial ribosomal protein L23, putative [Cordyceps militaris CM01]